MFFKKFDRISPLITLSFKGDNMHSSIIAGILSILAYSLTTIFGIFYALDFIQKKKPSAYFYSRFLEDAGKFTLNSSSLFHYFYFLNKTANSTIIPYDIEKVRIIGVENVNVDIYYSPIDLEVTPHWVYGLCKNNIDSGSIAHLVKNEEEFKNSACIRKYYNTKTKQYIDTSDEKNFVWPSVAHGMSHPKYTFYGVIIEKCKNDNLRKLLGLNDCKSEDAIDNYAFNSIVVLEIIDHYSDVLSYNKPFTKYFYSISNMIFPKSFTVNNMNYNPAIIKTHTGIFLDGVVEEESLLFSQNEKVTMDEEVEILDEEGNPIYNDMGEKIRRPTGIISSYYFWLQNRLQIYERNYKKLQDILSCIGGLSRTFFLVANIINSFFHGFFTLVDTEKLLFEIDNTDYYYEKIMKQKPKIKREKTSEKIIKFKKIKNEEKQNSIQSSNNRNLGKNDEINKKIVFSSFDNINQKEKKEKAYSETNNFEVGIMEQKNAEILYGDKNTEIINDKEKRNFNWFNFIAFKFCCRRNNPAISYYKSYRSKVISEENFIRGQLDIYKLEKVCKT